MSSRVIWHSKMGAEVMELLHRLNKEDGRKFIVMVTHNEDQAKQTYTVRF